MVKLNPFQLLKREQAATEKECAKVTPPSSPRGRQHSRDDLNTPSPKSNSNHHRSHAPARHLPKSPVKSDRDLYNDLLEEATGTNHTSNSSNSSLDFDGNNSSRSSLSFDVDTNSGTPRSPKKVIVDSLQPPRPKSPGHTGHERRQKFTFVGDMLDEDNDDGVDEFGEEDGDMDFLKEKVAAVSKPKAVKPRNGDQTKKTTLVPVSKPKKKPSTARCDAV